MAIKISYVIAGLLGLGMVFIGARFLIAPETATTGYGLHFDPQSESDFQKIKGIRDIFSGALICIFVLIRQRIALAVTLLAGTMIPAADLIIVLGKSYNGLAQAIPHIIAIVICLVSGLILLTGKKGEKRP